LFATATASAGSSLRSSSVSTPTPSRRRPESAPYTLTKGSSSRPDIVSSAGLGLASPASSGSRLSSRRPSPKTTRDFILAGVPERSSSTFDRPSPRRWLQQDGRQQRQLLRRRQRKGRKRRTNT